MTTFAKKIQIIFYYYQLFPIFPSRNSDFSNYFDPCPDRTFKLCQIIFNYFQFPLGISNFPIILTHGSLGREWGWTNIIGNFEFSKEMDFLRKKRRIIRIFKMDLVLLQKTIGSTQQFQLFRSMGAWGGVHGPNKLEKYPKES